MGLLASPDNVQASLDQAAQESGTSTVNLEANTRYSAGDSWQVHSGVILDASGAHIVDSGADPVISVADGAGVRNPYIDQRPRSGWSGAMIQIPQGSPLGVWNAHLLSEPHGSVSGQTGVHLTGASGCRVTGYVNGCNDALRVDGGASGNGVYLNAWSQARGVVTRNASNNQFVVQMQPHKSPNSEWMWVVGDGASGNVCYGRAWEAFEFAGETQVRWESGAGASNTYVDDMGGITTSDRVVNDSGDSSNQVIQWSDVGTAL